MSNDYFSPHSFSNFKQIYDHLKFVCPKLSMIILFNVRSPLLNIHKKILLLKY